ncbi:helix-turn-helix domain-containing protein [Streptomyces sp. NPDC055025]
MGSEESVPAGRAAEDAFIRQMKTRRVVLGLSQGELADRVAMLGGGMYQQTIAKLEAGQRSLKLSEADVLAQALGTTVGAMLRAANAEPAYYDRSDSRNIATLEQEVESVLQQMEEAAERTAQASDALNQAEEVVAAATQELKLAQMRQQVHAAETAELKGRYQNLTRQLATWRAIHKAQDSEGGDP